MSAGRIRARSRARQRPPRDAPKTTGVDRRRWWRNLPTRQPWSAEERERKLKVRAEFMKYGLTVILSIIGSSAVWVMQTSARITSLEIQAATAEARTNDRLNALARDIERLSSYFGVPAPRNPGQ